MREITDHKVNGINDGITIEVIDEPGSGGANHHYLVSYKNKETIDFTIQEVKFQNGPIKEAGVNGTTHEVLLSIVADRLRSFQAGPYSSKDNAVALTHIETALLWLQKRTNERLKRGVEGTHQK